ncbi:MAG: DEAD/DEAH box helicase [Ruminococcaceae bacterium]|nr:DEAD/DEAH box helicase [Oscillospiraceae bacterium]
MSLRTFEELNLSTPVLEAIRLMGFSEPTSIQEQTIPVMMNWRDIIAKAPTGTGKTGAFGIPIIEHLEMDEPGVQALILAPTRELALQITGDLQQMAATQVMIRITTLYGGQPIDLQLKDLRQKPQIVVATPGRLIDHLRRRTIRLDHVKTVVLDEADRMLDMGFIHDVRRILDRMPRVWQIAMFSATLSRAVMDISWIYQREVVELTVEAIEEDRPHITQYAVEASGQQRIDIIHRLVDEKKYKKVLVFCNTKQMVRTVTQQLQASGSRVDCIHGDLRQSQRERVIKAFRTGRLTILVATDVASRGLDIEEVDAVFNYEIPEENEHYIHRIGRTGRAQKKGVSYTFTNKLSRPQLDEIIRLTGSEIEDLVVEPTKG